MRVENKILKYDTEGLTLSASINKETHFGLIAECSNKQPDSQSHIVAERFLKKMGQQLNKNRVPFIAYHDMRMPLGRSIRGILKEVGDDTRVLGEFKIKRDWNFGADTNEFIKGVEDGTLEDVSIGAKVRDVTCNLCGKQAFISPKGQKHSDFCWDHFPGQVFDNKKAMWILNDGYLIEVSSVMSGANPNAEILDYTRSLASEIEAFNKFDDPDFESILPFIDDASEVLKSAWDAGRQRSFFFDTSRNNKPHEPGGSNVELTEKLAKLQGQANTIIKGLPSDAVEAIGQVLNKHADLIEAHTALQNEKESLEAKAKQYDAYYDECVADAIKLGVIAEGEDFAKEKWTKLLKGYDDLSLVDLQKAKWKKDAATSAPEGEGRQSSDEIPNSRKSTDGDAYWDDDSSYE